MFLHLLSVVTLIKIYDLPYFALDLPLLMAA